MTLVRTKARQWRLSFQNVSFSLGDNDSFIKTNENTLRFKGKSWESLDGNHKKRAQQQKSRSGTSGFYLHFVDTFVGKCNGAQARRGGRGRGEPTIIYIKEIIRFNNHLHPRATPLPPDRGSSRWAPHPPLRGGSSSSQEPPALPIPSYPALCREDTTSWNHGRPRTHNGLENHRLPATHQLLGPLHVCHAHRSCTDWCSIECWQAWNCHASHAVASLSAMSWLHKLLDAWDQINKYQIKNSTCTCVATFRS
jgi:hypothetical protein